MTRLPPAAALVAGAALTLVIACEHETAVNSQSPTSDSTARPDTASHASTPAAPVFPEVFESDEHGFRLRYPEGWRVKMRRSRQYDFYEFERRAETHLWKFNVTAHRPSVYDGWEAAREPAVSELKRQRSYQFLRNHKFREADGRVAERVSGKIVKPAGVIRHELLLVETSRQGLLSIQLFKRDGSDDRVPEFEGVIGSLEMLPPEPGNARPGGRE